MESELRSIVAEAGIELTEDQLKRLQTTMRKRLEKTVPEVIRNIDFFHGNEVKERGVMSLIQERDVIIGSIFG